MASQGIECQVEQLRVALLTILLEEQAAVVDAWLVQGGLLEGVAPETEALFRRQAEYFLSLLARGLQVPHASSLRMTTNIDLALQQAFPLVYRVQAMLVLGNVMTARLHDAGLLTVSSDLLFQLTQRSLATFPLPEAPATLFTERLARMNQLSWKLNSQQDEESILQDAIIESAQMVGADSSAIWLWDADQQVPILQVLQGRSLPSFPLPPSLLRFLRQACESCCGFSIDAGETDARWPVELYQHSVAFIPLPAPQGCIGVLTVHQHVEKRFSHDDILLLLSLGNLVATALSNAKLHANEHHLINLLQSSMRQLAQVASGRITPEELIFSLLQVAEGLTRADAVCALVEIQGRQEVIAEASGMRVDTYREALVQFGKLLQRQWQTTAIAPTGALEEVDAQWAAGILGLGRYYMLKDIIAGGQSVGMVFAISATPFIEEQATFLHTISEQIGVGVEHIQQSAHIQRLLVELTELNYISSEITSTFDPQRIMATISRGVNRALSVPITLSGWCEEDGSIRVLPETTVGLTPELEAEIQLTEHNAVIRQVLEKGMPVSSRTFEKRTGSPFSLFAKLGVRDWICAPMTAKARARGIVLVGAVREREFSSWEIALLSTYASQAALAMENSLLYEQVQFQLQQMETLYRVLRGVSSTLDLEKIYEELLHAATTALQTPAAVLCTMEHEARVQQVTAVTGIRQTEIEALRFAPGEGVIGTVGERGTPIVSTNLASDGRASWLRELAQEEGFSSSLTVPLRVRGQIIGTLTTIARETRAFSAAEEQLLQAIATEGAVAIVNARSYEQAQQQIQHLTHLVDELTEHSVDHLEIVAELLEIARDTEPAADVLDRCRDRVQGLLAVAAGVCSEAPNLIDVKTALEHLVGERYLRWTSEQTRPVIRVTGASCRLPLRSAAALVLFIHEWLRAALRQAEQQPDVRMHIAFQQSGQDFLIQIEDSADWQERSAWINHAIIEHTSRVLQATMTETTDTGTHIVRLRFTRASGQ
ncbi:MAG: GAF domain-containing protein [Armatimonadota bacterium]